MRARICTFAYNANASANANDTAQRTLGASYVVYVKGYPLIIPEIELREIAVKVLLAAVLVDAAHPSLED